MLGTLHLVSGALSGYISGFFILMFYNCITVYSGFACNMSKNCVHLADCSVTHSNLLDLFVRFVLQKNSAR